MASWRSPDGVERSDCVWVDHPSGSDLEFCGKPMVALVDYGTHVLPRSRTCQEHLDVVLANHPDALIQGQSDIEWVQV